MSFYETIWESFTREFKRKTNSVYYHKTLWFPCYRTHMLLISLRQMHCCKHNSSVRTTCIPWIFKPGNPSSRKVYSLSQSTRQAKKTMQTFSEQIIFTNVRNRLFDNLKNFWGWKCKPQWTSAPWEINSSLYLFIVVIFYDMWTTNITVIKTPQQYSCFNNYS